jgi:RNA polymerase-binding transcription factor DksA
MAAADTAAQNGTAAVATNDRTTQKVPAPRTDIDMERFRKLLLDQKALIEETLGSMESQDAEGLNTSGTERAELSTADENHPGDTATEMQLMEQDRALSQNEKDVLARIERALQKIDEGTYGLSDRSFAPIPVERLEAMPWATLTVEEQSVEEISE